MRTTGLKWAAACTFAAAVVLAPATFASFGSNDLIPRKIIFGNPERTAPFLSPDGSKILFTAAVDGVMNIWVAPTNDVAAAKPLRSAPP